MPYSWLEAIVIPIYKKGNKDEPSNYRPISFPPIVGKLYARYLNNRLITWIEEEEILGNEQAGFRKNRSTFDHCIVLNHLAEKYMGCHGNGLFAAFIDLKSAFDSIPRGNLWEKLYSSSIDKRLLYLIRSLPTDHN